MKVNIIKKATAIMLAILLSVVYIADASALQAIDRETKGSIKLAFENTITKQCSFSIYKIGELKEETDAGYELSEDFKNLNTSLESLNTAEECKIVIESAISYIEDNNIEAIDTKSGDDEGNVKFEDLSLGLYLIKQDKKLSQFEAETILISVPTEEDSNYLYDVEALPKYSEDTKPTTPDSEKPTITVKTNDNSNILPLTITMIISIFAFIIVLCYIKSDSQKDMN